MCNHGYTPEPSKTGPQTVQTKFSLRTPDSDSCPNLLKPLHEELRRLAASWLRTPHGAQTLQPTALVNEAFLRIMAAQSMTWQNRAHFMAVAAKIMRQILIDHVRKNRALKRGGRRAHRITLHSGLKASMGECVDLLALHESLNRLSALSQRQASIVELRVFGALTIEETAEALGIGVSTVKSEWLIAKTWLKRELAESN